MSIDVNNPYFRTKVLTASQEELRLLLIEGALRFARTGRDGLANKDFEKVFEGFSQARDIVSELLTGLRPEQAPEVCANLSAIYNYIFRLLVRASLERDLAAADEAIQRLEYARKIQLSHRSEIPQIRAGNVIPFKAVERSGIQLVPLRTIVSRWQWDRATKTGRSARRALFSDYRVSGL